MTSPAPSSTQIQRQIKLPLRKAAEIALRSLKVRMTRSVLTLITIVMAIAFLTYTWANASFEPAARAGLLQAQHLVENAAPVEPSRVGWLISLSLLVCMVGISNAMLMSVMERFREIGTMKCLGALDSFILKLFLLESVFLGAAGTAAGVVVGLLLTFGLLLNHFGWSMWAYLPWGQLPQIIAGSLCAGIAITALAALYPAWRAARMQPIAAMRVDV